MIHAAAWAAARRRTAPPVESLFGMKTIVEYSLHDDDFVVMQAGTHTESIRMNRDDWERLCEPVIAAIAEC